MRYRHFHCEQFHRRTHPSHSLRPPCHAFEIPLCLMFFFLSHPGLIVVVNEFFVFFFSLFPYRLNFCRHHSLSDLRYSVYLIITIPPNPLARSIVVTPFPQSPSIIHSSCFLHDLYLLSVFSKVSPNVLAHGHLSIVSRTISPLPCPCLFSLRSVYAKLSIVVVASSSSSRCQCKNIFVLLPYFSA